MFDAEQFPAVLNLRHKRFVHDLAAGHIVGELVHVEAGCRFAVHHADTVAQNGYRVRHAHYLFELMRHEDNGNPLLLELANDGQQRGDFLLRQSRGRLVHDDQFGVLNDGAADRDDLLVRNGKRLGLHVQIDLDVQVIQRFLRFFANRAPVDKLFLLNTERVHGNIIRNRQVRENREILVDNLDSQVHRLIRL
ncbi:hypothetical protein SDC9_140888 [bioreactor metagenome]|uniref:Uncharacterized protein n=1 Tax=bioreactor metagenome TaxID=1076179 RepID=A0A645DWN5_9ZZZZ